MTSRFEHSDRANYLVLCTKQKEEKMADRMLIQNEIRGLLPVRIERINGYKEYYYDISSRHSLESVVKKGSLNVAKIQLLIKKIGEILNQFHEYMLEPDGICLSEEFIYTVLPEWDLMFCYFEGDGGTFLEKIRKLLQFVIEYVDYQDKEAVTLAYACYQAAMQENFTFSKIEDCIFKSEKFMDRDKTEKEIKSETIINKEEEKVTEIRLAIAPKIQSEVMEEEVEESSFDKEKARRISCYIVGIGSLLTGGLWFGSAEGIFDTFGLFGSIPPFYMLVIGLIVTLIVFIIWSVIKRRWKEKTKLVIKEINYPFEQNRQRAKLESEGKQKENFIQSERREQIEANQQRESKKEELKENLYREGRREQFKENRQRESKKEELKENLYREDREEQLKGNQQKVQYREDNLLKSNGEKVQEDMEEEEYGKTMLLSYRVEQEHRVLFSCQKEFPSVEIIEYPCLIGKLPSLNQIVITHEGISRIHCSIQEEEDGYSITDRNSTNGVFVNGRRLMPNETAELPIESEIVFGILRYIFR